MTQHVAIAPQETAPARCEPMKSYRWGVALVDRHGNVNGGLWFKTRKAARSYARYVFAPTSIFVFMEFNS